MKNKEESFMLIPVPINEIVELLKKALGNDWRAKIRNNYFSRANFLKAKMLKKMKLPANVATPLFVAEIGSRNDTLWFNGIIYTTGCFTGTKKELLEKSKQDGFDKFEIYKKAIEQIEKSLNKN